jgi:spore germination cell wall hydrolase CwlJ-like protein
MIRPRQPLLLFAPLFLAFALALPNPSLAETAYDLERLSSAVATELVGNELQCLTKAVYYEARGEPTQGKAAVAWVIVNRVTQGFAPSICEVVHQGEGTTTCQFSFVCEPVRAPVNSSLFDRCRRIAYDVLIRRMYSNVVPGAINFHAESVEPGWTNLKVIKQIGTHIFYKR